MPAIPATRKNSRRDRDLFEADMSWDLLSFADFQIADDQASEWMKAGRLLSTHVA
jgi:hypothetical protein